MGFTVEPWAREWLEEQRRNGVKCYEVKVSNGNHYVYYSTSRYDPETKSARKVSEYLGSLDPEKGFVPKEKDARRRERTVSIRETGTVRLLDLCAGGLLNSLKRRFPENYDQLYALALMRCINPTPLKRASSYWEKFDNFRNLRPAMSPKSLSQMLEDVGSERYAQDLVFNDIGTDCRELAFDLSEFFSASEGISFAEEGRNAEHNDSPQINIAMICAQDSGVPVMVRMIPGSVRDMKTVCATVKEMGRKDVVLVADRGFYTDENIDALGACGMKYVMPVKRNSILYGKTAVGEYDFFEYRGRLIRFGKYRHDKHWAYRFRDETMRAGEERAVFMKYKEGKLSKDEVEDKKERMGQMILVSNIDMSAEEAYLMYKRRDSVEKRFSTFRSTLEADACWLRDNVSAFGHVFVTFLSMFMIAHLEDRIRKAGILSKYSPEDVMVEYSKAYAVEMETGTVDYEIPKKLEELDKKLGLNIFPILRS
ncbi:MAG: transposase [Methanomassiliicoccaceae archaeon]|nr:transposase [Methanomassiliicoccaceae archaeon]